MKKHLRTLTKHTTSIYGMVVYNELLYSYSRWHLHVWDIKGNYIQTLKNPSDALCAIVYNDLLHFGTYNNKIMIFNKDNACVKEILGHTDWIYCFIVYNNLLYSGSWDGTIR